MAGQPIYSLSDAREQLREWLKALERASTGATYSIGGRTLTRQDIPDIRAEIQRWHNMVLAHEAAAAGRQRPMGATASFPTPGGGSGRLYSDEIWRDGRN